MTASAAALTLYVVNCSFKRTYGPVDREVSAKYKELLVQCYGLKYQEYSVSRPKLCICLVCMSLPLWLLFSCMVVHATCMT